MSEINIEIEFERYISDWRVGFLKFIINLLGFRYSGGSIERWKETARYDSKKYKWVEQSKKDISGED